jgi:NTE family protein
MEAGSDCPIPIGHCKPNLDKAATLAPGWRCADVDVTVRRLSFDDLGPMRARELSKVSTRFVLPPEQVTAIIKAGRDVVRIAQWERQKTAARLPL